MTQENRPPVRRAPVGGLADESVDRALLLALKPLLPGLRKALLLPPDYTRRHSGAGRITASLLAALAQAGCEADVMPALGTHAPMSRRECESFFLGAVPYEKLIAHDWRSDAVKLGEAPGDFVAETSGGAMDSPIDVEVNRRVVDPSYGLVISIGQVVPHEVVGMANHNKNIFVGCGGSGMVNASHMLGAAYGIERVLGRCDTPVRRVLDYAEGRFLGGVKVLYVLTVVAPAPAADTTAALPAATTAGQAPAAILGLFIGQGREPFLKAASLSREKNVTLLGKPIKKAVVYLDKDEYKSMWLGNKAIYRTRMAIADGGELVVLAPGVVRFGEDAKIDRLIRKHGYAGRERILESVRADEELRRDLSAPAHLIHGSTDGRFAVTYAARGLSRAEVEGVGYRYMPYWQAEELYRAPGVIAHADGWGELPGGEEAYFIGNPALGLWATRERMAEKV